MLAPTMTEAGRGAILEGIRIVDLANHFRSRGDDASR